MHPALALAAVISLLIVVFALGCSRETPAPTANTNATEQAGLPDRDPSLARKLVSEGAVLLDVRTTEEYGGQHIEGAVNIPVGDLNGRLSEVDKLAGGDKNKPIVVYCRTGNRSGRAKSMLLTAGYTKVTNLGGIDAWEKK